jgi:hypothetical protein
MIVNIDLGMIDSEGFEIRFVRGSESFDQRQNRP